MKQLTFLLFYVIFHKNLSKVKFGTLKTIFPRYTELVAEIGLQILIILINNYLICRLYSWLVD